MYRPTEHYSAPVAKELEIFMERGFLGSDPDSLEDPSRNPEQDW